MLTFEPWRVVRVPFPYTDRPIRERRPALVVAAGDLAQHHGLLWVLMITSEGNRPWTGDVRISDPGIAGLPAPSVVRCAKVATIDTSHAEGLGVLPEEDRPRVRQALSTWLAAL